MELYSFKINLCKSEKRTHVIRRFKRQQNRDEVENFNKEVTNEFIIEFPLINEHYNDIIKVPEVNFDSI
jgi:hypothetical protein